MSRALDLISESGPALAAGRPEDPAPGPEILEPFWAPVRRIRTERILGSGIGRFDPVLLTAKSDGLTYLAGDSINDGQPVRFTARGRLLPARLRGSIIEGAFGSAPSTGGPWTLLVTDVLQFGDLDLTDCSFAERRLFRREVVAEIMALGPSVPLLDAGDSGLSGIYTPDGRAVFSARLRIDLQAPYTPDGRWRYLLPPRD